jgi:hypothetical protein
MAIGDLFPSAVGSFFGGGGGMPTGYSGLTPDQVNMVNNQGYFMNPDAYGTSQAMPQGYSNLTPAQIQAVNQQGYFTNPDATQPDSLWDKLSKGIGSDKAAQGIKQIQGALAPPQPRQNLAPSPSLPPWHPMAPVFNIYRRSSLDPETAFKALQMGT